MNNFWMRTFTGILFVSTMISCMWWSYFTLGLLFMVITVLGLWEFYSLINKNTTYSVNKSMGIITGASVLLSFFLFIHLKNEEFLLVQLPFIFACFFIELLSKKTNSIINLSVQLVGIIYVALPFSLLLFITHTSILSNYSPYLIISFFILVWTNDTFAYLAGRLLGKHKLFERISPKKTWEGTIGGAIFSMITAFIIGYYMGILETYEWGVLALLVSITATCGDLVESSFKRSLNIKDSGNILPGHGGILDRFDGVLLAAPFAVTYILLIL
ncbi:MAG TPA: phosphatidate cytidylyltransferase [Bacteroidia bacterium]|nr:phosphatidate cytidylyltransferase [Bacteroidia bacterium]